MKNIYVLSILLFISSLSLAQEKPKVIIMPANHTYYRDVMNRYGTAAHRNYPYKEVSKVKRIFESLEYEVTSYLTSEIRKLDPEHKDTINWHFKKKMKKFLKSEKPRSEFVKEIQKKIAQNTQSDIIILVDTLPNQLTAIETNTGSYLASHRYSSRKQWDILGGFSDFEKEMLNKYTEIITPLQRVKMYVEQKMNIWQKKGKYEKTIDYQKKITDENRQAQISKYTQEAIQIVAEQSISLDIKKNEYDADNEVFKLIFEHIPAIFIKIPRVDAPKFDKSLQEDSIKIEEAHFTLDTQSKIVLLNAKIRDKKNQKTYMYNSQNLVAFNPNKLKINLKPITIDIHTPAPPPNPSINIPSDITQSISSDISQNIPQTQMQNPDAIAVIIGNTNYEKTKNVDFAQNDAELMKQYLIQSLGYKEGNIFHLKDIHKSEFEIFFGKKDNHKGRLFNAIKANQSEVFIYYSGHGVPSIQNKSAYFAPVECDPNYVELSGYSLDIFYNNLAKIPAKSMTIVLDACFSGADIYENISPIIVKSKGIIGIKNGTLLASCQGNEVSSWYNEKGHGLFTYFFLKAIHNQNADADKNGKLTFKEIQDYISNKTEGVPYFARRLHGIEQNPTLQGEDLESVFINY